MKFEDIAKHIEDTVSGIRLGRNLFINRVPADVTTGVLLKETYAGTERDQYIPGLRRGRFQVVVRGTDFSKTKSLIDTIVDTLSITEREFSEVHFKVIAPMTEPIPFMESDGGFCEFTVNFYAVYDIVEK